MITLTIDGRTTTVPKGTTVYHAAKEMGIILPIFCYQDRMPPFGACRVCLVEVEKMGKLQTSCTLEATEGMVVKTQSSQAVDGRKGILEYLLINHPLDCPICDKGGECPLQEQTLSNGPGEGRFYEDKRRFKKPLPLGPVLMLDRERCIVCARCTRFGDIVAGDHALEFIDRGFRTEVGTPSGEPVDSKFIGNTIQICPVGALTSQVYRFRARPWDNQSTPSTCTLCPVGCSLILDSRDGEIMRTRVGENKNVNDTWLCDKGWFGYEFTSSPARLKTPLIRKGGELVEATWAEAYSVIVEKLKNFEGSKKLAGFGGDPLTTQENFLFQQLFRNSLNSANIDHRIGQSLFKAADEGKFVGTEISLGEIPEQTFIILLGFDITEEFPVVWLRVKEAINRGAKVLFMGHYAPEVASHLTEVLLHAPGEEAKAWQDNLSEIDSLVQQGKGAIFVGSQYLSLPSRGNIIKTLAAYKDKNHSISLNLFEGNGNTIGARFAGMRPDSGPEGKPAKENGLNALEVVQTAAKEGWDFLLVAGANPALKYPAELWKTARAKLNFLVVQDLFLSDTAREADVVLPTLSYIEKGGSFINIEGRIQNLLPGKEVPDTLFSDGDIFTELARQLGKPIQLDANFEEALRNERIQFPALSSEPSTPENNPMNGLKATFSHTLFDDGVRMQHNSHLAKLVKGPKVWMHMEEGVKRGFAENDKVILSANGSEISAKLHLDAKVAMNTVVIPLGFEQIAAHNLAPALFNGLVVEIRKDNHV